MFPAIWYAWAYREVAFTITLFLLNTSASLVTMPLNIECDFAW